MMRWSITGRVVLALALVAALTACITSAAIRWTASPSLAAVMAIALAAPVCLWAGRLATSSWSKVIRAVRDGVISLRDHDFSMSIARVPNQELSELISAYNALGDLLRRERLDLYQRELLLDTVIQTTPLVMVLTNSVGRVVYSNIAARQFFRGGRKLEGLDFQTLLSDAPAPLHEALNFTAGSGADTVPAAGPLPAAGLLPAAGPSPAAGPTGDSLFTMEVAGEPQVYHLSQRSFHLNAQGHRLILLKQLTRELAAQEVAVWKKVIRVIAHELNNSLAPIASLVNSGRLLSQDLAAAHQAPEASPAHKQLARIFTTIGDRTAHLTSFIDGYARFAKLPRPRLAPVNWSDFLGRLEGTTPFRIEGTLPERPANMDVSQLEQVMINLLKNAAESGSAAQDIAIAIRDSGQATERGQSTALGQGAGFVIEVADRGTGLAEHVLRDALLPFYSTKPAGTGLGLTLCREIVEAHEGRLSIANRDGGGALVTLWLPG